MNNSSTGSVRATNKLIPELRFPDFANGGEWVEKELIDFVDKKVKWSFTGGPFGSNLKASDYTSKGIRIIQLQNIGDGEFNDDYKIYTSEEKADELLSCNIYSGEIILSKMGDPVGRACIIPDSLIRCVMASDGIRLVVDEKKYSKYFVYSLINSKQIREAIEKKATGSTRKRIGLDELREIELIVPKELNEQQKIASCLFSLDQLIAAHSHKLEALKNHKKGLMQNLLPQEGETEPKYRFPEFVNDGEWVEKTLDSLTTKISDGIHTTPNYDDDGEFYFINGNNLIDGEIRIDEKTKRVSEEEYNSHKRDLSKSTILLSINGTIGNIAVYNNEKVILGKSACYINVNRTKVDKIFIFYFIQSDCIKSYFNSELTGSTIKNLSLKSIKEIIIKVPVKPKEQQKIAECLSSLDALITAQTEKIEQLKLHKKGLMWGLFPKIIN